MSTSMRDIAGRPIRRGSVVAIASTTLVFAYMKYGVVTKVEADRFRMVPLIQGVPPEGQKVGYDGDWFTPLSRGRHRVAVVGSYPLGEARS